MTDSERKRPMPRTRSTVHKAAPEDRLQNPEELGEGGQTDPSVCTMSAFTASLLVEMWPASHVVMGTRVCKGVRASLLDSATHVLLKGKKKGKKKTSAAAMPDEECIFADLTRFRGSRRVELMVARFEVKITRPLLSGLVRAIPAFLDTRLTRMDLSQCIGPQRLSELASVLHMCSSLTHLYLNENSFGMNAGGLFGWNRDDEEGTVQGDGGNMERLSQALEGCTALVHLELSSNDMGNKGIASLAPTLTQLTCLTHLHLATNRISGSGATCLASALQRCAALQSLNLAGNHFMDDGEEGGIDALVDGLSACSALTELSMGGCGLMRGGGDSLGGGLFPNLRVLDVQSNWLRDEGFQGVCELLGEAPVCSQLQSLTVSDNKLSEDSCYCLAEILGSFPALSYLDLSQNRVGNEGATALAEHLHVSTSLTILNLGGNGIKSAGARRLAAVGLQGCKIVT